VTADELRELQDRGRFFYEMFPGAAAAETWKRQRDRAERQHDEELKRRRIVASDATFPQDFNMDRSPQNGDVSQYGART
jgi:hypothetical protein